MKKRYQEKKIITDIILKRIEVKNPSLAVEIRAALKENKRVYYKIAFIKPSPRIYKVPRPPKRVILINLLGVVYKIIDDGPIYR